MNRAPTGAHHGPLVGATFMTPSRTRGTSRAFRTGDLHDAQPDRGTPRTSRRDHIHDAQPDRGTSQAFRTGDLHDAQPDPGHTTDLSSGRPS